MYNEYIKSNEFYEKTNVVYELIYKDLNLSILAKHSFDISDEKSRVPVKVVKVDYFDKNYTKLEPKDDTLTLKQKHIIIDNVFKTLEDMDKSEI